LELCAQGAFFGYYRGVDYGGGCGTRPGLIPLCAVLVVWCFDTIVGGFSLYDYCKACQSVLNN
jgi:hypothetical protein